MLMQVMIVPFPLCNASEQISSLIVIIFVSGQSGQSRLPLLLVLSTGGTNGAGPYIADMRSTFIITIIIVVIAMGCVRYN